MELNLSNLKNCFEAAKAKKVKYIGIAVNVCNSGKNEVIINENKNFDSKLEYYCGAYNDDLTLKHNPNIKIVAFVYGNNYGDIEKDLVTDEILTESTITDNRNKSTMITDDKISEVIEKVEYQRIGRKTTICCLTLKNGFEVIGTSACVDPENFNEELGKKYAYEVAKNDVKEFEGYRLQSELGDKE